MIKTRPRLELRIPRVIQAGHSFVAELRLHAKRAVAVEFVDLLIEGAEQYSIESRTGMAAVQRQLLSLGSRLRGEGELPAGKTSLSCRIDLPPDLPPTYRGRHVSCGYTITAHCAIPWWRDARAAFDLPLTLPPAELPPEQAVLFSTAPDGPSGAEAHLELTVSSQVITPGGKISGAVALGNVAHHRYQTVWVALVAIERFVGTEWSIGSHHAEVERFAISMPAARAREGEPIPFTMKLPERLWPSTRSPIWALEWAIEVGAQVRWNDKVKLRIPAVVLPSGSLGGGSVRALPTIGSKRVRAVWEAAARELGLTLGEEELRGAAGDVSVRIARDHRGEDGVFLIAELGYRDLGLDLDGGLRTGFRRLGGGAPVGDERWQKRHYLTGREEAQVVALGQRLVPALGPLTLASISDERLLLERKSGAQSGEALRQFGMAALLSARALTSAREAVPAPVAMTAFEPAWRKLAAQLGGTLERGPMAARGQYHGASVEVATVWSSDGEPEHTAVILHEGAAPEHRLVWQRELGVLDGSLEALPGRAQQPLMLLKERATFVGLGDALLEARMAAPLVDPLRALDTLEALLALAAGLRGRAGPYR